MKNLFITIIGGFIFFFLNNQSVNITNKNNQIGNDSLLVKHQFSSFANSFKDKFNQRSFEDVYSWSAGSLNQSDYLWMKKTRFKLKQKQNSFYIKTYLYRDSLSCAKGFDLWLNNFGNMAVPIKRFQYFYAFDNGPMLAIISNKKISILFIDCELGEKYSIVLKSKFLEIFSEKTKAIYLNCDCRRNLSWNYR